MSDTHTTAEIDLHHADDLNIGSIVMWGLVSVVVTVVSVLGLHALYNWYEDQQLMEKSYQAVDTNADNELNRQEGSLEKAVAWVDKEKGIVGLPINRAIELTLDEYKQE
ncbi:MAG: hypothetical protein ACR2NU_06480 [Aeoliella sp.]